MDIKGKEIVRQAVQAAFEDCLEMGDHVYDRIYTNKEGLELVVRTRTSRVPSRNLNGGEYDFFTVFRPTEGGVYVYEDWSAEFDRAQWLGEGDTVPMFVTVKELFAAAQIVGGELYHHRRNQHQNSPAST